MNSDAPAPIFFETASDFRHWLGKHAQVANELWVGYYRKGSGQPSMTWPDSVDEALCFGWIDGIRKKVDDESYKIRFTPRKMKSTWSAVNIGRVAVLAREGRMQPGGLAAFARREEENSSIYAFENRESAKLSAEEEREFQSNRKAWQFFLAQPAGYRRLVSWRVISAKRPETRKKRLLRLISESEANRRM